METAGVAAVVSREDAAFGIDLATEGVATPFGEDFESARLRMITPDELPHRAQKRLGLKSLFPQPGNCGI